MKSGTKRLFEFAPYLEDRESTLALIKRFAGADAYRSAVVEELELDEDFHRRPLRRGPGVPAVPPARDGAHRIASAGAGRESPADVHQ